MAAAAPAAAAAPGMGTAPTLPSPGRTPAPAPSTPHAVSAVVAKQRPADNLSLIAGHEDHAAFQRLPEDMQQRIMAHPMVSGAGLPKGQQPMTPGAAVKLLGWSQPNSRMGLAGAVQQYMPAAHDAAASSAFTRA